MANSKEISDEVYLAEREKDRWKLKEKLAKREIKLYFKKRLAQK